MGTTGSTPTIAVKAQRKNIKSATVSISQSLFTYRSFYRLGLYRHYYYYLH